MNLLDNFAAAAMFGSVARGDNDSLSDRDLLVVSELPTPTRDLETLRAKGISPAAYTWDGLDSLARYRSLFLLHLKLESKIVKDHNLRLSSFLERVEPSNDYSLALKQSVALAALTSGVPPNKELMLWAADVLAVALRNYLVALAAQRKQYLFAYYSLVEFADDFFGFDSDARNALLSLRQWKASYRKKGSISSSASPSLAQIKSAQRAISSITGIDIVGSRLSVCEFTHGLLNNAPISEPWYHSVRRYEGAYRAIDPLYFKAGQINMIERQIASPCCYTNDGQVLWKVLRHHVRNAYLKSVS